MVPATEWNSASGSQTCRHGKGGEATHVPAHLGPAGLETVDTLIMAGIADDRADAIRLVLPRFREQPEYEQLRERVSEIDRLRAEC